MQTKIIMVHNLFTFFVGFVCTCGQGLKDVTNQIVINRHAGGGEVKKLTKVGFIRKIGLPT